MSIAITTGEPAGIGLDLIIINAQQTKPQDLIIFSDPDLLIDRAKILNLPLKIIESKRPTGQYEVCVHPIKAKVKANPGKLNVDNVEFVLKTIDCAAKYCLEGKCQALLTGPINKEIINKYGINFSGHTEYLAKITNTEKTVMMLATEGLRVALATTHIPLSAVSSNITAKSLHKTIVIIHDSLIKFGIKNPKILICGLNPHAGEGGYLGREEVDIIDPLIAKLKRQNYNLIGTVAADTAFTSDSLKGIDVVLAMYHDQGLPILKTIGFKKSVNVTLGLPFIRTSVDHGTALDLAASGNISLGSFNTALEYTQRLIDYA